MSALPPKADIGWRVYPLREILNVGLFGDLVANGVAASCYSGFTPAWRASAAHFGISVAT